VRINYRGVEESVKCKVVPLKRTYHVSKSEKRAVVGTPLELELSIVDSDNAPIHVNAEEFRAVLMMPDGSKVCVCVCVCVYALCVRTRVCVCVCVCV
jgi:hypothetical protein